MGVESDADYFPLCPLPTPEKTRFAWQRATRMPISYSCHNCICGCILTLLNIELIFMLRNRIAMTLLQFSQFSNLSWIITNNQSVNQVTVQCGFNNLNNNDIDMLWMLVIDTFLFSTKLYYIFIYIYYHFEKKKKKCTTSHCCILQWIADNFLLLAYEYWFP